MRLTGLILFSFLAGAVLLSPSPVSAAKETGKEKMNVVSDGLMKNGDLVHNKAVNLQASKAQLFADGPVPVPLASAGVHEPDTSKNNNHGQAVKKKVHNQKAGARGNMEKAIHTKAAPVGFAHHQENKGTQAVIQSERSTGTPDPGNQPKREKPLPTFHKKTIDKKHPASHDRNKDISGTKKKGDPLPIREKKQPNREDFPQAVVPSVPQPVTPNGELGMGGQALAPFIIKAWMITAEELEPIRLFQPYVSRIAWLTNQWVNAPPAKPPEISSFSL